MRRILLNRRVVLSLIGGAAACPITATAQGPPRPIVGFLSSVSADALSQFMAALFAGLAEQGFERGRNISVEFRFADGDYTRLPALAKELARKRLAAIVAGGGNVSALAAMHATSTIPIVFTGVADPVRDGLVASLARPGGNVTGISVITTDLDPKRFELLCEALPAARLIGTLVNPRNPSSTLQLDLMRSAAKSMKRELLAVPASETSQFEDAFAALVVRNVGGIVVLADPFFTSARAQIVALVTRHRIPGIFQWRDFAVAGGFMSYGPSLTDSYRQAGVYTGRIVMGERPANLPVLQPTKFELVINVGAAKALGIPISEAMLTRADEVIE